MGSNDGGSAGPMSDNGYSDSVIRSGVKLGTEATDATDSEGTCASCGGATWRSFGARIEHDQIGCARCGWVAPLLSPREQRPDRRRGYTGGWAERCPRCGAEVVSRDFHARRAFCACGATFNLDGTGLAVPGDVAGARGVAEGSAPQPSGAVGAADLARDAAGAREAGVGRAVPPGVEPVVGGRVAPEARRSGWGGLDAPSRRKHARRLMAESSTPIPLCSACRVASGAALRPPSDLPCEVCGKRPASYATIDLDDDREAIRNTLDAVTNLFNAAMTAQRIATQLGVSYLLDAPDGEREGFVRLLVDALTDLDATVYDSLTVVQMELGLPIGDARADADAPPIPVCGDCIDRVTPIEGARLPWDDSGEPAPCSLCSRTTDYRAGGAR